MPRPRKDLAGALERKGFELHQGKRDHDFYMYSHDGLAEPVFTKLSRGSGYRTLGDPILRKIQRQLRLTKKEFGDFIDCPLTAADYLRRLQENGIIRG